MNSAFASPSVVNKVLTLNEGHFSSRMALLPQHRSSKALSDQKPILSPSSWEHTSYGRKTIGYAKVAEFIATDKELAIYRRFDRTAARVLLALQSEILSKQNQLDNLDAEDALDPDEKVQKAARTIDGEFESDGPRSIREEKKLRLCKELRGSLKEYYELLKSQSDVLNLPSPVSRVTQIFHRWLRRHGPLLGLGESAYFGNLRDLCALRPAKGEDRLSQFLKDHCGQPLKKSPDADQHTWNQIYYVPEARIEKAVTVISVIIAAILLIGAILSLYWVTSPHVRLGMLAGWTSVFALSVNILSTSTRAELFGATAAYAAVLVVFVSGNLGGS